MQTTVSPGTVYRTGSYVPGCETVGSCLSRRSRDEVQVRAAGYRLGSPVAPAVLAGAFAFFTYYYVSQVFGIAQNRLFRSMLRRQALPDSRWSWSHGD